MNRIELKNRYGHIMDTDKLIDDMMTMLTHYRHRNTEMGVRTIISEFFTQKKDLIDLFVKSPNYKGDLRIVREIEIPIEKNSSDLQNLIQKIIKSAFVWDRIATKTDDKGKTLVDYRNTGKTVFTAKELTKEKLDDLVTRLTSDAINQFNAQGYYLPSAEKANSVSAKLNSFAYMPDVLDEVSARRLDAEMKKFTPGMKTSRAFQRVWKDSGLDAENLASKVTRAYNDWNTNGNKTLAQFLQTKAGREVASKFGYDTKDKEKRKELVKIVAAQKAYNQLSAQLFDMLRTKARKLQYVISLNPLDYLGMSFGVNWRSCHTIDRGNIRHVAGDGYSGMYMNGTMSYMLDSTSIITYCLTNVPETDIHEVGKVYRCMFHYKDFALIQGRIYPQGSDGKTDLYKIFRYAMQKELTGMLGLSENKWRKSGERYPITIRSLGRHYHDYEYFRDCNLSYPVEKADEISPRFNTGEIYMTIGHPGICPTCGRTDEVDTNINANSINCRSCGN